MKQQLEICGHHYRRFIVNAQLLTPTFGQPMKQFYRANDIEQ
jgi:hypothetical protein